VIFEVLTAVCVNRAVVLLVTPGRLIEIYRPFFFYQEVRGGRILHLYGGNRASCFLQNICKCLPDFISRKMKFWKHMYILFIQEGNRPQWEFKVNSAQVQQKPCIPEAMHQSRIPLGSAGTLRISDTTCNLLATLDVNIPPWS